MNLLRYSQNLIITAGLGILLVPLVFFFQNRNLSLVFQHGFIGFLGVIAGLGVLGLAIFNKKVIIKRIYLLVCGLASFLVLLLSASIGNGTFFSPIKSFSLSPRGTGGEILILSSLALIIAVFWSKERWQWFVAGLFGLTTLISSGALLSLFKISFFGRLFLGTENSSPLLMNINQAGVFAGLGILISIILFWSIKKKVKLFTKIPNLWQRILFPSGAIINFLLVITIGTRFIIFPLFLGLLGVFVYFLLYPKTKKTCSDLKKTTRIILLLLILLALFCIGGEKWRLRWATIPIEPGLTQEASFEIVTQSIKNEGTRSVLFGGGWGSFRFLYEKYRPPQVSATPFGNVSFFQGTSEFWTFSAETGLAGLLGLFGLFGFSGWFLIKNRPKKKQLKKKFLEPNNIFLGILISSSIYLIAVFFLYPFTLGMWAIFVGGFAGLSSLAGNDTLKTKEFSFSQSWVQIVLGFLVLIILGYFAFYPIRIAIAEVFIEKAQSSSSFSEKIEKYNQARWFLSNHPRPLMLHAQELFGDVVIAEQNRKAKEEVLDEGLQKRISQRLGESLNLGREAVISELRDPQLPFMMVDIYLQTAQIVTDFENAVLHSLEYVEMAEVLSPSSPYPPYKAAQAWFLVAEKSRQAGDEDKENEATNNTEENLKKALEKNSEFFMARVGLVELAFFRKQDQKTILLGEEFLIDYPNEILVRQYVSQSYYNIGELEKGRAQVGIILGQNRNYLPALMLAGEISAQKGDFSKAIDYFERARAQIPENEKLPEILSKLRHNINPFTIEEDTQH